MLTQMLSRDATPPWQAAVVAFPNLMFTNALGFAAMPGDNHLFVWEREGRVWSFVNDSNTTTKTLVLDISNQCQGWDDSGLLNLAFHPGFDTNRYVFLYYTWVTPGTVATTHGLVEYSVRASHSKPPIPLLGSQLPVNPIGLAHVLP